MGIEISLLLLESVLLIVTVILLIFSLREGRGRRNLLLEVEKAKRKGYRIPSEGLAAILKEYFYRCWEKNMSYDEYLRELIKQTGAPFKTLASELQIDEEEIERIGQIK